MRHSPLSSVVVLSFLAGAAGAQVNIGTGPIVQQWATNCASCHGAKAGGTDKAKSLLVDNWRDPALDRRYFESVQKGIAGSEAHMFAKPLTNPEAWALIVYLREMQELDSRERHGSPKPDAAGVYTSQHAKFKIEPIVTSGLNIPWSVNFLPDGRMLITERNGNIRVHSGLPGGLLSEPISGTPHVRDNGQGGLMDIVPHPQYAKNGWIYISYSDELMKDGKSLGMTKIVRGKIKPGDGGLKWTEQETVFQAKSEHYLPSNIHFGSRIAFDPTNPSILFFSVGERGYQNFAPDLKRPNGKIHRLMDDGKVPADNPFNTPDHQTDGTYTSTWSFGHRNPQGLSFDLNGNLWDTEHAPRGGDEFNQILKGKNYGWPTVTFGMNYNGTPFATPWPDITAPGDEKAAAIQMPADRWLPSIGASGLDVVRVPGGKGFKDWEGDLIAGGLSGQNVDRIRVKDGKVIEHEELLQSDIRVRAIRCGPDGSIYVVYNEAANSIVRLAPVK